MVKLEGVELKVKNNLLLFLGKHWELFKPWNYRSEGIYHLFLFYKKYCKTCKYLQELEDQLFDASADVEERKEAETKVNNKHSLT